MASHSPDQQRAPDIRDFIKKTVPPDNRADTVSIEHREHLKNLSDGVRGSAQVIVADRLPESMEQFT